MLYVTERCVFRLTPDGLELIEIAPGIDLDKLAHLSTDRQIELIASKIKELPTGADRAAASAEMCLSS